MDKPLVNRVAASSLITLNLEDHFPEGAVVSFDLKDYLFKELILKEKDFREALQNHDWSQYEGKNLLIFCSTDAIIPLWAFMLVAIYAEPHAREIFQGTEAEFHKMAFTKAIEKIDASQYSGQRIVIKGCGHKEVPPSAYVDLTKKLRPFAKSIMFGEPCSTVPIYKAKKG